MLSICVLSTLGKSMSKTFLCVAASILLAGLSGSTCAQSFTENFDDINVLAGNGWVMQNNSVFVGATNWFQGTNVAAGGPFDAYNGAANAYIGANYNNTGSTGTISNWLMQPNRTLRNGDVLTFYTRKASPDSYADRLEVRLSTNGASTNAGSGVAVGDFTTLLLSVNPTLVLGVYPTTWTQYTITMSGLPAPTSGRMAFRYFVTNGGASGTNSDYIGIDNVVYTPYVCPAMTISPLSLPGASWGQGYSQSLSQTGALGAPNFAITSGALPPGMTLSLAGAISGAPTATGTFNFTVTVYDASGCSGSMAYAIAVTAPTPVISPAVLPAATFNSSYSQAIAADSGNPAYTFSVSAGSLPSGLSLDSGGLLSGTPTVVGTYPFTVQVIDAANSTATQDYTFSVEQASAATSLSSACQTTFVENQPFTFVANISGVPTGTVDFFNGATNICPSVAVASGSASCVVSDLAVQAGNTASTLTLKATYSGDANYTTSTSPDFVVTVLSAADVIFRGGFETDSLNCPIE
jgi:hypothetical protein